MMPFVLVAAAMPIGLIMLLYRKVTGRPSRSEPVERVDPSDFIRCMATVAIAWVVGFLVLGTGLPILYHLGYLRALWE
jgi:hypothetical protein